MFLFQLRGYAPGPSVFVSNTQRLPCALLPDCLRQIVAATDILETFLGMLEYLI